MFAAGSLLAVFVALLVVSFAVSLAKRESVSLPDHLHLQTYVPALASKLRAADGSELAKLAEENRKFVAYDRIPQRVIDAFVSAEDRNYWRHAGVDWAAVIRAALTNLRERSVRESDRRPEGGSSITQQVAKNLLVGDERSVRRKIREALVAIKMDRDLGKKRVLEIYLNEVYLGAGAFGVGAAAETYFGKELDQLSVAEAATLAGLPKAPSAADPFRHPDRAAERRNYVIRRLFEDGKIARPEAEAALTTPIALTLREEKKLTSSDWFVAAARRSLVNAIGRDILLRGGFRIDTTLRPEMQRRAEAALRRGLIKADRLSGWRGPLARITAPISPAQIPPPPAGAEHWHTAAVIEAGRSGRLILRDGRQVVLPAEGMAWARSKLTSDPLRVGDVVLINVDGSKVELQQIPQVEGALVALDPRNGDVMALVGGFSRELGEFDRATQARRQTGSSFKSFVYLTALTIGYDPTSALLDVPFAADQGPGQAWWRPGSYGGGGGLGLLPMSRSLEMSRNLSSIRLLYEIGTGPVGNLLRQLGMDVPDPMPLSAGLGALETTPMSMAAAYASMANGGRAVRPRFVSEISGHGVPRDADLGGLGPQVVTAVEAAMMESMLRSVVVGERGTARRAFRDFPGWVAGKTGTTNDSKDAWFVAAMPEIALAVWIGRDDNKPLPGHLTGGAAAAPIARDFLESMGTRLRLAPPELPSGARMIKVDPATGQPSEAKNAMSLVVRASAATPVVMPSGRGMESRTPTEEDEED